MKSSKYFFIPLIALILCISSCRKKEDACVYSGNFSTQKLTDIQPIRMFVKGREITDPMIIQEFLARRDSTNFFPIEESKFNYDLQNISFLSADEAVLTPGFMQNATDTCDITELDGVLYFESRDTITSLRSYFDPSHPLLKINKYNYLYFIAEPAPASSGFNYRLKMKLCIYAQCFGAAIKEPYFRYFYFSGPYASATFIVQNKYAENAPAVLHPNDTLLIQEFNVTFYKDS